LIFVVGNALNELLPDIFKIWTACMYLPMFALGVLIRQRKHACTNKIHLLFLSLMHIILFVITYYVPGVQTRFSQIYMPALNLLLHSVGAVTAFFVLQLVCSVIKDSKTVKILAKHSMCVYLFHQQIIYFVITALNGKVGIYYIVALSFLISLAVSLVISKVLSCFKVTRICIGEK
jgi:surface polysaccharide O-acyltransferase-like enzyme